MSKHKGYAEHTSDHITKITDLYGWRSDISTNFIQAQIAINLALISDCLVEIYGSERRKEIDKERGYGI